MTAAEKIVKVAVSQEGTTESPRNSNNVFYNTWYYGREVSGSAYPWCCVFVCWVFHKAGYDALVKKTASCTTLMNWFKNQGLLVSKKSAAPGDVVFYQFDSDAYADHVGIVNSVIASGVYAIEGNTSSSSDDNGGAVMMRLRAWDKIMAVARPDYKKMEEEIDMTKEEVQTMIQETVDSAISASAYSERKTTEEKIAAAIQELSQQIVDAAAELKAELTPKVYTALEELPEWAKPVVSRLLEAEILHGDENGKLHLTDDDLVTASMVDQARQAAAKTYDTVDECPAWAREAVSWAISENYIQGDENGALRLNDDKLWALQVDYNQFKGGAA